MLSKVVMLALFPGTHANHFSSCRGYFTARLEYWCHYAVYDLFYREIK